MKKLALILALSLLALAAPAQAMRAFVYVNPSLDMTQSPARMRLDLSLGLEDGYTESWTLFSAMTVAPSQKLGDIKQAAVARAAAAGKSVTVGEVEVYGGPQ